MWHSSNTKCVELSPKASITECGIHSFVQAYGFYYSTKAGLKETGRWRELQGLVSHFIGTSQMPFPHGYNPNLRFMAHLWEPLRWTHRCVDTNIGSLNSSISISLQIRPRPCSAHHIAWKPLRWTHKCVDTSSESLISTCSYCPDHVWHTCGSLSDGHTGAWTRIVEYEKEGVRLHLMKLSAK
jgi:hypothetical protein